MYYLNKHKGNAYIESYDNIPDNFWKELTNVLWEF